MIGGGAGVKEIDVAVGALGSEAVIEARARDGDLEVAGSLVRVVPTEIDLLFESDSYVPPFYKGRAMPSAGTLLHLEAIPRFKRTDGSLVAPDGIIFTWKRGGSVIPTPPPPRPLSFRRSCTRECRAHPNRPKLSALPRA